jgi:DNA-3-methyladenine glycosylase II
VLVRIPEPFDFTLSTVRFRDFGSDRSTVWHEGGLHRVIAGREARIEPARGGVDVEPADPEVVREVGLLLGLSFDLDAFRAWAERDEVLGRLARALSGFRPTLNPRAFEALVIAITAQQISLRAAAAIRARFVELLGIRHEVAWEFPSRERVARAGPDDLTSLGFSIRKAEYVLGLARSDLDLDALSAASDADVIAAITGLRGLGRWTADWFLARHLARPEAWPAGDLGVRKAVSAFYADSRLLSTEEVRTMGERFAPFQNLSANFLLAGARLAG